VASDLLFAEVFSATDRILWYQKGNPHRRIAETTIALDASLHSTAKLSTGKLSIGKRAFVKVHKFFPMGFGSTSPSHLMLGRSQILTF
jgi:hypothetical protein